MMIEKLLFINYFYDNNSREKNLIGNHGTNERFSLKNDDKNG